MYDLHVHVTGHDPWVRDYSTCTDAFMLQAEALGLEAMGVVEHLPYRAGTAEKVREKIEYYKRHADFLILYGAEVYLPSSTRIPKYFDYAVGHTRGGYNLEEAFLMAQQKGVDIIAHPCAYGAVCSDIEGYTAIALELSEKTLEYFPRWLYERALTLGIPLTLGSDAHAPEKMGFASIVESGFQWTPLNEIPFVEAGGWL